MSQKTPFSKKDTQATKEPDQKWQDSISDEGKKVDNGLNRFPKQIFILMVLLIVSSILAFVFIPVDQEIKDMSELSYENAKSTVSEEVSTLLDLGVRAKRMAVLKSEMERILLKDTIDKEDSIFLEEAMQELGYFNNQKPQTHED